jgi:4-amino-4-deoxy-L-arabinose transferase-like glycosyltransferase
MKRFFCANFLLILILLFSFLIRYWQLGINPAGFFCDEASMGVDALSILKTGRDHHGELFPLFFKGFNYDNTSPYQVYLTVPFIGLFGLNEKSVRLAPVFWSTIELLIFYLLLVQFIPKNFALLGTFLLSISPWHFHISRINMGDYYTWTLLTLLSYFFLVKAFKTEKLSLFSLSAVFFGLATYSYTPARLTTPLLFGLTILLLIFKKYLKVAFLMVLFYSLVLIPFIHFHLTDPHSLQRIRDTMGIDIKNQRLLNQPQENRLTHFTQKYLLHYSNLFLFQKGDTDFPGQFIRRHSISGLGLLYPYQKWLIIIGLLWLVNEIFRRKRSEVLYVFFLLFLFPVADSLTNDGTPFATRSYLGVLPFNLLIAFGFFEIFQAISKLSTPVKKMAGFSLVLIFSLLISQSAVQLFRHFNENPLTTSDYWGWQYGPRDTMKYFLSVKDNYDDLYLSGEFNGAEIFPKFYDPKNRCQEKCKIGDFWREPAIYNSQRRQLFSLSPEYLNNSAYKNNFLVKHTLYYPDGKIAFLIGEVK